MPTFVTNYSVLKFSEEIKQQILQKAAEEYPFVAAYESNGYEDPLGRFNWLIAVGDKKGFESNKPCLLYTSPSPRDRQKSRMPSSA